MLTNKFWGALLTIAIGTPAFGTSFTFNFNSLTGYSSTATNQATSIASQLTAQLHTVCPTCSVTMPTTTASNSNQMGAVIDKTYTGEGRVVGPTSGSYVVPETLGDVSPTTLITSGNSQYTYSQLNPHNYNPNTQWSSIATNQFLATTNDSSQGISSQSGIEDQITMQFHGLTITGVSFNYEIFPDGSGQTPDLTFEAGNGTQGVDSSVFQKFGVKPCASVNGCGGNNAGTDGSKTHSISSGSGSAETSLQYIGSWSGTFSSSTELDFVDWPATIGIADLSFTYTVNNSQSPVPEPGSVFLFGAVAVSILFSMRRRQKA